MAREEEKLFSVKCSLNDGDFDDVFRIYMDNERGNEKKIALVTCIVLFVVCIVLLIVLKNITFIFYGLGCLIVGLSYFLVPVNKKFIAANRLQLGTEREMTFYPSSVASLELLEDEAENELTDEEREEAETVFSTAGLTVYENKRGFLLADGKIVNNFLYIPKRCLTDEECALVMDYVREKSEGGYHSVEAVSVLGEDADAQQEDSADGSTGRTAAVCDQFYGGKRLHLYDDDGHRVHLDADDAEEEDIPEETAADAALSEEEEPDDAAEPAPDEDAGDLTAPEDETDDE